MGIGLRDRLGEAHLKFVAAQGHLLVVRDEVIERVKDQVVCQEELGGPSVLPGVDPAVLDFPVPPAGRWGGGEKQAWPRMLCSSPSEAPEELRGWADPQDGFKAPREERARVRVRRSCSV